LDPASLPSPPPKRKSNFLHTLSRFTSANAGKAQRSPSVRRTNNTSGPPSAHPSNLNTPVVSPTQELGDPFDVESNLSNGVPSPNSINTNSTITGLAAYLTTISNTADLRQVRVWKRFVRVRTDDLESVRVERAIKRVRSDLAAHVLSKSPTAEMNGDVLDEEVETTATPNGSAAELESQSSPTADAAPQVGAHQETEEAQPDGRSETREGVENAADLIGRTETLIADGESKTVSEGEVTETTGDDENITVEGHVHATPKLGDADSARIHRPQSAELDVPAAADSSMSQAGGDQTGDESSTSTTGVRRIARKKRSQLTDPSKEPAKRKTQRKVVIDDFEMIRVLGKGCAGKVLLVRHKSTTDLYALKAITKRHVLAHQELQHTLTEQAVLKRMAAEGADPFVVKLWWSFHDKENLFLVMVCLVSFVSRTFG
jgi:hypothetical protein